MPNPDDYESKDKFMEACVPMAMGEGRENDQAVAMCNAMWDERKSIKAGARHNRALCCF